MPAAIVTGMVVGINYGVWEGLGTTAVICVLIVIVAVVTPP